MPLTFDFGEHNRPEHFEGKAKTPVTLLSGFLGSGKTTLLKHLLQNQEGVRIGVVVNDVAAVNIDSQLVRRYETGLVEVTELQNGCVCCSSADDLFSAVQTIVMRSKDHPFEHIVVELTGVGEPEAVKRNWTIGLECTMPVALRTEVRRVVTVVDASTFGKDWLDTRQAQDRNEQQIDGARHDEKNQARFENVGQLLAEQVEWADVVVVNKVDLASGEEMYTTEEVVQGLNANATMVRASFGKVPPSVALPKPPAGLKTQEAGEGDGYRWSQTVDDITVHMAILTSVKSRDIELKVLRQQLKLGVKGQGRPRVEGKLWSEVKNLDDVVFEIEGSGAGRVVVITLEKRRPGMWPDLLAEDVTAKQCPHHDGSHDCGHGHSHEHEEVDPPLVPASRATKRFGIHSFSYQRRRPFSSERFGLLMKAWPTLHKDVFLLQDLEDECDDGAAATAAASVDGGTPGVTSSIGARPSAEAALQPILRAKGFCWLDGEPLRQHVLAHAGRTLSVMPKEWWWAALDKNQHKFKLTYPGVEAEYRQIRREKWDASVGDRRQELVFIGLPHMQEDSIVVLLDECLLTDAEYADYKEQTRQLKVPNDEFELKSLLGKLGASPTQLEGLEGGGVDPGTQERAEPPEDALAAKDEDAKAANRAKRRRDREDTDLLRSLGVGSALESLAEDGAPYYEPID